MNREQDMQFFFDMLKKLFINTTFLSPRDSIALLINPTLRNFLGLKSTLTVEKIIENIEARIKYMLTDEFKLRYICLQTPILSEKNILFIGPYLSSPLSPSEILEIGERAGINPAALEMFNEFFLSVPIIPENDRIFTVIDSFCEFLWGNQMLATVDLNENSRPISLHAENSGESEDFDKVAARIKMLEARYAFENELIHSVAHGYAHNENLFSSAFDEKAFEKRSADPLRNTKNYCIIMNTLLRKAAEQGGVHPIYIDGISSNFANKIELMTDAKSVVDFMREMYISYCKLVHKHSISHYSPIVKKTILIIDSDITAELSLNVLAKKQRVSAGYLATIFKKETGKTVSEYIKDKRINEAKYLLRTTHLQIQTIALHCGIMDVQYFSKAFKKKTGKSPSEYRNSRI
jgi:AraC-like DNA-binding protein